MQTSSQVKFKDFSDHPQILKLDKDFQIINRKDGSSIKYIFTLSGKKNHNIDKAIVLSYADMQFKFSPQLNQKLIQKIINKNFIHYGYSTATKQQKQLIIKYIEKHFYSKVKQQWMIVWESVLSVYRCLLNIVTKQGDEVLFLTPVYYYFIQNTKDNKRKCIQCNLQEKNSRLMINFQKLQECFQNNNIKLFVFVNPHNPTGRVWSYQQLQKLSLMIQKYKCFVFSDQIFALSVRESRQKFTSLLNFQNIHDLIICASSNSKTFNCSNQSSAFTFSPNNQITKQLTHQRHLNGSFSQILSFQLLLICLQHGDSWKKKCYQYIDYNQKMIRKMCSEYAPLLQFYNLQAGYLILIDFKGYKLYGNQLEQFFDQIDVYPTILQSNFVQDKPRSLARFNLACNFQILQQGFYRIFNLLRQMKLQK